MREVREESGLEIRNPHLRGQLTFTGFKGDDWYVFVFTATEFDGELKENGEGFLKWIPDEALESLHLWPSDHIFFPWLREEKFFSAKFVYKGRRCRDMKWHSIRSIRCAVLLYTNTNNHCNTTCRHIQN